MRYDRKGLIIELESEEEITDLMNIIEFAFDYENEHKGSLYEHEKELAEKLLKITKRDYSIWKKKEWFKLWVILKKNT